MGYRNKIKHKSNKIIVSPQTLYHLHQLAELHGYKNIGKVVDELVRDRIIKINGGCSSVQCKRESDSRG